MLPAFLPSTFDLQQSNPERTGSVNQLQEFCRIFACKQIITKVSKSPHIARTRPRFGTNSPIISSQTSLNLLTVLTGLRLYVTCRPFMANRLSKNFIIFLCSVCWVISIILGCIPYRMEASFVNSFYIERNLFIKDQVVNRSHLEDYVYKTEHMWTSVTNSTIKNIVIDHDNFVIKNLDNWYFATSNGTTKFPNRQVKVKGNFGYYSYSAVCFPNLFSQSSPDSEYSLAILLFNFFCLVFIVLGYAKIYLNTKKSGKAVQTRRNEKAEKKAKKMRFRISLIILTDLLCWLPIIFMGFVSYAKHELSDTTHIISTIVILPINSLINPIIYSKLGEKAYKKLKKLVCPPRICGDNSRAAAVDEHEMTNLNRQTAAPNLTTPDEA